MHDEIKEKFLPILVGRTAAFFFLMAVLTLFLYAVGTTQDFIDSTQFALIRLYVVLGIFLAVTSSCGMILNVGRLFKRKAIVYLFRALGYILLALFAVFTVLTALFILTMAEGNV